MKTPQNYRYKVTEFFNNDEGEETSIKWLNEGSALDVHISIAQILEQTEHGDNPWIPPINRIVIERLEQ